MPFSRLKIFSVTLFFFVLLGAGYAFFVGKALYQNFLQVQDKETAARLDLADNLLAYGSGLLLTGRAERIAYSDETVYFIRGGDEKFPERYLNDVIFQDLDIHFAVLVDSNGKIMFSRQSYAGELGRTDVPTEFLPYVSGRGGLLRTNDRPETQVGLFAVGQRIVLLAALPVHGDDAAGAPLGTFIVGRYVDDEFLAELSALAGFAINIFPVGDHTIARSETPSPESDIHFVRSDSDMATGHTFVTDIFGAKTLIIEVVHPALTIVSGRDEIKTIAVAAGAAALAAALFAIFVAEFTLRACMARRCPPERAGAERTSTLPPGIGRFS